MPNSNLLPEAQTHMIRPKVEWDPTWDDDWQAAETQLADELEEEHPRNPEQAVQLYRYGFGAAQKEPATLWSAVESDLYEDYMSGAPEPGYEGMEDLDWEQARAWAQRGWEAAKP